MDRAGDELLPGAGLAGDEHRGVGRRHLPDLPEQLLQRRAPAHDLLEALVLLHLLAEVHVLGLEPIPELCHLREQPGVLDGDGRVRREDLDDLEPLGRERSRRQVVLQVEHPDQAPLVQHRRAQHRPRLGRLDVGIARVLAVAAGVLEHDAFAGAPNVVDHPLRQLPELGQPRGAVQLDARCCRRAVRLHPRFAVALEHERPLLGAGVLQRELEQRAEQTLELDLSRDGPRCLHDARQVQGRRRDALTLSGRQA